MGISGHSNLEENKATIHTSKNTFVSVLDSIAIGKYCNFATNGQYVLRNHRQMEFFRLQNYDSPTRNANHIKKFHFHEHLIRPKIFRREYGKHNVQLLELPVCAIFGIVLRHLHRILLF